MPKVEWKPGNMLYPLPVVLVSVADEQGKDNIITVAWAGTVCTNPPHGIDFCAAGAVFLSDADGYKGICDQSDHREAGLCNRLLWREIRP